MQGSFYEFISHHYKGSIFPFQVRWQQCKDTPVILRSVKKFKCPAKAFLIKRNIFNKMIAFNSLACATAFKNYFLFKIGCFYSMGFKKLYGQKRDFFYCIHFIRPDVQRVGVRPVKGVIFILKIKKFYGRSIKIIEGYLEYFIFPIGDVW